MKKLGIILAVAILLSLAVVSVASAQGPYYEGYNYYYPPYNAGYYQGYQNGYYTGYSYGYYNGYNYGYYAGNWGNYYYNSSYWYSSAYSGATYQGRHIGYSTPYVTPCQQNPSLYGLGICN